MRNSEEVKAEYGRWLDFATANPDLIPELKAMSDDTITDAFYRDLAFGTGGLRGTIGAGTNRMNVYTVAKATTGLSNYINETYGKGNGSVVIGYDSRIKSQLFAHTAAMVFDANGIKVNLWNRLLPVPTVSFATRYLHASAGVMITASHNPSKYNGYKVYGSDGCQINTEAAAEILSFINMVDALSVSIPGFTDSAVDYISDEVLTSFFENVKKQSVLPSDDQIDRNVAFVYSSLNGTGREPVTRVLNETGFTNITLVKEQEMPDGNFPTCPYPNPEIREAMELGLSYCKKVNADLMLATDPDCDRCGIAVKDPATGDYKLLTGNETGMLLLDFICSQRIANHTMPKNPVLVKTIVTTDMGQQIADHYGVKTVNVLTGFKFIGEQIGKLEKEGHESDFVFGFEESYGYLSGTYVRDKDAVDAAFMICEMFAYYKTHGINLIDKLDSLYKQYGYRLNTLHAFKFDGESGMYKMQSIMEGFHKNAPDNFGGLKVDTVLDYSKGLDGLPKSDVLKYLLEGNSSVVVRPSGTEPKLKMYISISDKSMDVASQKEKVIAAELAEMMK